MIFRCRNCKATTDFPVDDAVVKEEHIAAVLVKCTVCPMGTMVGKPKAAA